MVRPGQKGLNIANKPKFLNLFQVGGTTMWMKGKMAGRARAHPLANPIPSGPETISIIATV